MRKALWRNIKIGEIFAFNGCWAVLERCSKTTARVLAVDDYQRSDCFLEHIDVTGKIVHITQSADFYNFKEGYDDKINAAALVLSLEPNLYKLSKATQNLWRGG